MKLFASITLSLFLLLGTIVAQEVPEAESTGIDAFLSGLSGYDESLAGETAVKVLFNTSEIGSGKLAVSPAPEGSGGVYRAILDVALSFGPMNLKAKEDAILDEKFALVSSEKNEMTDQGGTVENEVTKLSIVDGKWVRTRTVNDKTRTSELAADRPNHESALSLILLSRKMKDLNTGDYLLQGGKWPGGMDPEDGEAAAWQKLTFSLKEPSTQQFGDVTLEVRAVLGSKAGEEDSILVTVASNGAFVSFEPQNGPIKVMAADLPTEESTETVKPGSGSPEGAVAQYFLVLAGSVPPADLNKVMDWVAIHKDMAAESAEVAALDAATLGQIMIAQFAKQAGVINEAQAKALIPMLVTEVTGDTAIVAIPGKEDDPFHLRKTDAGWLITKFPR